jgi:hypothetical protein
MFRSENGLRLGWVRWVDRRHGVRGWRNVIRNTSIRGGGSGGVTADKTRSGWTGCQFIILQKLLRAHRSGEGVMKTCVLLNGL